MRIRKSRRGMNVGDATEREILRRQMELLAEDSTVPGHVSENTHAMMELYRAMSKPGILLITCVLLYFAVSILVGIKKLLWSWVPVKTLNVK